MKISDTPTPFFLLKKSKQSNLFYQPLHFYGKKNLNPLFLFWKISKNQNPPFIKVGEFNYALAFWS